MHMPSRIDTNTEQWNNPMALQPENDPVRYIVIEFLQSLKMITTFQSDRWY